jgi:DeoR/GlpR family transcriptional regulator of sugar metabolism
VLIHVMMLFIVGKGEIPAQICLPADFPATIWETYVVGTNRMLTAERRNAIKDLILKNGSGKVDELARQFNVSEETIRRDLALLDRDGIVEKNYGGATALSEVQKMMLDFTPFQQRRLLNVKEKKNIDREAASMVAPGMAIFIDGGSTTCSTIPFLSSRERLTVITNSLEAGRICAQVGGWTIIILGGQVVTKSMSMVGPHVELQLSNLSIDVALMGATGVSVRGGCTSGNLFEANIKKKVLERSDKGVLLVDSSKMGTVSPFAFAHFSDFDTVITSPGVDDVMRQTILAAGAKLIVV